MNRNPGPDLPDTSALRSFIRKRVNDQAEAEDVLQDVYEEYLEATNLGVVIDSVGAWLAQVARNKILDRFRRRKTQRDYLSSLEAGQAAGPGPEDDWTASWIREALLAAIEELPPEQREVFIMYELEGKSYVEIATLTGVNLNTLLARKRYAVKFLRERLKEIYDELE